MVLFLGRKDKGLAANLAHRLAGQSTLWKRAAFSTKNSPDAQAENACGRGRYEKTTHFIVL
jgi:hypothetical protein